MNRAQLIRQDELQGLDQRFGALRGEWSAVQLQWDELTNYVAHHGGVAHRRLPDVAGWDTEYQEYQVWPASKVSGFVELDKWLEEGVRDWSIQVGAPRDEKGNRARPSEPKNVAQANELYPLFQRRHDLIAQGKKIQGEASAMFDFWTRKK